MYSTHMKLGCDLLTSGDIQVISSASQLQVLDLSDCEGVGGKCIYVTNVLW